MEKYNKKGRVILIIRLNERLFNILCPSRWINNPTAGIEEKKFNCPRFFFADTAASAFFYADTAGVYKVAEVWSA